MKKWTAVAKNGNILDESGSSKWTDIKNDIAALGFDNDGQIISLPKNMEKYIQAKTASADLSGGEAEIQSRSIGFYLGNNIVRVRIDEHSNNISIEID